MKEFYLNGNAAFFFCFFGLIYSVWLHLTE
jgi:hypothetical protein